MGQRDRLAALWEQVDDRNAAQRQGIRAHHPLQLSGGAVETDEDVHPIAGFQQGLALDPGEIEEQELFREGEVFGQQPEAGEAASRPGQDGLLRREADGCDDAGRQDHRRRIGGTVGIGDGDRVRRQQFQQRQRHVGRRTQEQPQPVEPKFGQAGGAGQRRLMRSTAAAPAARGLGGAVSGRPDRRTLSISMGHKVCGQVVR